MVKTIVFSLVFNAHLAASKDEASGMRRVVCTQFMGPDCTGKSEKCTKVTAGVTDDGICSMPPWYEGCYGDTRGLYKIIIDEPKLGEATHQAYGKPGCDPADKGDKIVIEMDKCNDWNQKCVIETMAEDYGIYAAYDHDTHPHPPYCVQDEFEAKMLFTVDEMTSGDNECICADRMGTRGKCRDDEEKEGDRRLSSSSSDDPDKTCLVWQKYSFSEGAADMTITRHGDKNCNTVAKLEDKDGNEFDWPAFTLAAGGGCVETVDYDCDGEQVRSHNKLWLTMGGVTNSGQALQISQGVIAFTSLVSLMATVV